MPESGGVCVCCEHGVITNDGSKGPYWVPYEKYSLACHKDASLPLPTDLQSVRTLVLAGTYDPKGQPCLYFAKYVDKDLDSSSPVKRSNGCECKKGCTKACGCKKKGMRCHIGCTCNENCV